MGGDNPYKSVEQHNYPGNVLIDRSNNISTDLNHPVYSQQQSHVTSM
jgi:hypothetical protein